MLHVKLSGFVPLSVMWRGKPIPHAAVEADKPAWARPTVQHDIVGTH